VVVLRQRTAPPCPSGVNRDFGEGPFNKDLLACYPILLLFRLGVGVEGLAGEVQSLFSDTGFPLGRSTLADGGRGLLLPPIVEPSGARWSSLARKKDGGWSVVPLT